MAAAVVSLKSRPKFSASAWQPLGE